MQTLRCLGTVLSAAEDRPFLRQPRRPYGTIRCVPGSIHAYVSGGDRLSVEVVSDQGAKLILVGAIADLQPVAQSDGVLKDNPALVSNAWAFAKTWYEAQTVSSADALALSDPGEQRAALEQAGERRKAAEKRADAFAKVARWIADVPMMCRRTSRNRAGVHRASQRRSTGSRIALRANSLCTCVRAAVRPRFPA